jgi:hypothetical protein
VNGIERFDDAIWKLSKCEGLFFTKHISLPFDVNKLHYNAYIAYLPTLSDARMLAPAVTTAFKSDKLKL